MSKKKKSSKNRKPRKLTNIESVSVEVPQRIRLQSSRESTTLPVSSSGSNVAATTLQTFGTSGQRIDFYPFKQSPEPSEKEPVVRWLKEHPEELKKYTGQWVAITEQGIIAAASSMFKVLAQAEDQGIRAPLTMYVRPDEDKDV